MSKRHVALLVLAVLFALSVTAFAVAAPTSLSAPSGVTNLASYRHLTGSHLYDPQCPPIAIPGCGGG